MSSRLIKGSWRNQLVPAAKLVRSSFIAPKERKAQVNLGRARTLCEVNKTQSGGRSGRWIGGDAQLRIPEYTRAVSGWLVSGTSGDS